MNAQFRMIEEYPFMKVREKLLMERELLPDVIEEAITEFRKYLILIVIGYKGLGMISAEVDAVWHTFILFTRDYSSFCNEVLGSFLHHQPSILSDPLGPGPRKRFLEAYEKEFGALPAIWGGLGDNCFNTCDTPSTNCQDPR